MNATELNTAYAAHLERMLQPPRAEHVNKRSIKHMLAQTRRAEPCRYVEERRTWIWSDLHLHHRNIIRYCTRPYDSVEQMDQALYATWKQRVQPDDVVICGGDVALAGSLDRERLARVQALPGRKLLVMGNHDLNRRGRPTPTGFDEASMTMLIEHDTPLLLTHVPLDEVPPGCVNIHGHVHNNVPLGHTRHINICVENTGYEPVRLEAIRMLADQLVAGWTPPGETTLERLHAAGAA